MKEIEEIPKTMYAGYPINERNQLLSDNCTKIEAINYSRQFTEEELDVMRHNLSENSVEIQLTEEELDNLSSPLKEKIKGLVKKNDGLVSYLRNRFENAFEECYKFIFQENGEAVYYNSEGILVKRRPILPEERQKTIGDATREKNQPGLRRAVGE
jgi:hypothetical protein